MSLRHHANLWERIPFSRACAIAKRLEMPWPRNIPVLDFFIESAPLLLADLLFAGSIDAREDLSTEEDDPICPGTGMRLGED